MNTLIISRHGESVAAAAGIVNGDPARDAGLTARGRSQAEGLGEALRQDAIDLCITSEFPRAQETAVIALAGRDVSSLVHARWNDIRYGDFEGQPRAAYHEWAMNNGVEMQLPGGGESRGEVARRLCEAMSDLLTRDESTILVVAHELLVCDLLAGAQCTPPPEANMKVEYARPYRLTGEDVARSIEFLREWLENV